MKKDVLFNMVLVYLVIHLERNEIKLIFLLIKNLNVTNNDNDILASKQRVNNVQFKGRF